jgi:diguanylate cyclase (GGDEF)-like protein
VSLHDQARNTLGYGFVYQFPFYAMLLLCAIMATRKARRSPDLMWAATGVVFAITAAYFAIKPFFAAAFGSGATMRDYAASSYALFSQALGGILTIAAALMVLLKVMRAVLRSTRDEAETDMLTRVANRRGFERRATQRIAAARRGGDPLAVIMLDVDHFKRVNDCFGHATGDTVLHAVAQAICAAAPAGALVARLGGEEFAALLGRTTAQGAALTGEAIRAAVSDLGPHLPRVTISGGVAMLRPDDTIGTLLDRADRRAYQAKHGGRDRIYPAGSGDR